MQASLDPCSGVGAAPLGLTPSDIWQPAASLTPRVSRLRDEYWSFYQREIRNEARSYTTGATWDTVYSIWSWTNVPEVALFQKGFRSYLLAAATPVALPPGFWEEPLPVRQALFFREVISHHLPTHIFDGELVVGSHFSTALSRCLTRREAAERDRQEEAFLKEWRILNELGVGNCAAVPGHLIPDYPKALRIGWQGIRAEAQAVLEARSSTPEQRVLARAIIISADAVRLYGERYALEAQRRAAAEPNAGAARSSRKSRPSAGKVPWKPPETFPEALQALWTTHLLLMAAESYPGPGVSPGRVDQYLYPYFEASMNAGGSRAALKEWLECWMIKHNYAYDYQGWTGTNQGINSSFGQLITLGGILADGSDASNDLTYLFLDAIEELASAGAEAQCPDARGHARPPAGTAGRNAVALAGRAVPDQLR